MYCYVVKQRRLLFSFLRILKVCDIYRNETFSYNLRYEVLFEMKYKCKIQKRDYYAIVFDLR